MSVPPVVHQVNNLLAKILGAAELALDVAAEDAVRRELELIAGLAEEGSRLIQTLQAAGPPGA
jgi:hypothetical protein